MAWDLEGILEELTFKVQGQPRYTTALKTLAANRAIDWVVLFASENYDVYSTPIPTDPANSSQYAMEIPLPTDLLVLETVSWSRGTGQDGWPLRPLTLQEFVQTRAEFSTRTGPPFVGYFVRGNRFINIWPRPGTPVNLQIYYLKKPADLAALTDIPVLERAYSPAIISYALYWMKRGQPGEDVSANTHLADALRERAEAKYNLQQNQVHKITRK